MKITNEKLKQLIKEELDNVMMEMEGAMDYRNMDYEDLNDEIEDLYYQIKINQRNSREEKQAKVDEFLKVGRALMELTKGDMESTVYSMWEDISKLGLNVPDWPAFTSNLDYSSEK